MPLKKRCLVRVSAMKPPNQKYSFSAIWRIRGSPALVIRPKLGDPNVVPGLPRGAWLNKLKYSARYCSRRCLVIRMFFSTEKLTLKLPGPIRMLRPALPKVPRAAGTNELVANHCATRCPRDPDV